MIWLTARPVNTAGSRTVRFAEVAVTGETDIVGEALTVSRWPIQPSVEEAITAALAQNFERDFSKLRGKIDRALANRTGRLTDYSITIENVPKPASSPPMARGLYLPVDVTARLAARLRRLK